MVVTLGQQYDVGEKPTVILFFGRSDGMEREACVCDHGFERSDLCAEILIIIIIIVTLILVENEVNY